MAQYAVPMPHMPSVHESARVPNSRRLLFSAVVGKDEEATEGWKPGGRTTVNDGDGTSTALSENFTRKGSVRRSGWSSGFEKSFCMSGTRTLSVLLEMTWKEQEM